MKGKLTRAGVLEKFLPRVLEMKRVGLGRNQIAERLSIETGYLISPHTIRGILRDFSREATVKIEDRDPPPSEDDTTSIDELIDRKIKISERHKRSGKRHRRQLELPPEPVGLLILGDPHVDNNGCDFAALRAMVDRCANTPGVLAACVGDLQDNWIGRLARIYSESETSAADGWRLSRWLLEALQWIAIVGGNHDAWAHGPGVDPLGWLTRECGVQCYAPDELRITLNWKKRPDLEPIVWILRHDFSGRSWYHSTHGPHKEAILDGRCHLLTAGHIHQWGQLTTEQRHGRVTHAVRVRGFKRGDSYARARGFAEQIHGAACLVVLDPLQSDPGRIQIYWDVGAGCDALTALRAREGHEQH